MLRNIRIRQMSFSFCVPFNFYFRIKLASLAITSSENMQKFIGKIDMQRDVESIIEIWEQELKIVSLAAQKSTRAFNYPSCFS